jgi:hypothetical protein
MRTQPQHPTPLTSAEGLRYLEVSRLARSSTEWHRLLEICALTDGLILDEDGLYDPGHSNDRLLLGLKGTMSEAELPKAGEGRFKQHGPGGHASHP